MGCFIKLNLFERTFIKDEFLFVKLFTKFINFIL